MKPIVKKTIKVVSILAIIIGSHKLTYTVGKADGMNEMRQRILMNPQEVLQMIKRANNIGEETP